MTEGLLSRSPIFRLAPLFLAATLLAALGMGGSVLAAQPPSPATSADTSGPRWNELGPSQRKVLAPLAPDWNSLDSRSKERWIDVADRFPRMPVDEQQRATQRMGEWAHMTVAQRQQARMNFQQTRNVSKEEREARWKAYQALPEEKKKELATRAAPASAAASGVTLAHRHIAPPLDAVQPKTNVVNAAAPVRSSAGSGPAATPARPGVTTTLLNRRAAPPAHQRDGQPKIAAGPNSVDRKTLLPKHTTVAAASNAASAPPAPHR